MTLKKLREIADSPAFKEHDLANGVTLADIIKAILELGSGRGYLTLDESDNAPVLTTPQIRVSWMHGSRDFDATITSREAVRCFVNELVDSGDIKLDDVVEMTSSVLSPPKAWPEEMKQTRTWKIEIKPAAYLEEKKP